jgi:hypothetical protein
MNQHADRYGLGTIIGCGILIAGATISDLSYAAGNMPLAALGNALSVPAGLLLICLPLGLFAAGILPRTVTSWVGTVCWGIGTAIVSLVDVPAIFNPTDLSAGGAFGPIGLVLISVGFLAWFVAIQRTRSLQGWQKWLFLLAGLWFVLSFPTIQLPLFVIPNGRPLFLLLGGFYGLVQLLMGVMIRARATRMALAT